MFRIALFVVLMLSMMQAARALEWQRIGNAELGFRVSVPIDVFTERSTEGSAVHLSDAAGDVVLDLYAAENSEGVASRPFADEVAQSDRIEEVTYRRVGRSWFVLSGYYAREGYEPGELVFYTKFMFSADRSQLVAFEISYPVEMKDELDDVVERIEDTFRPLF